MALLVKCLPCKHEDASSRPTTLGMVVHGCNLSTREVETEGFLGTSASLA